MILKHTTLTPSDNTNAYKIKKIGNYSSNPDAPSVLGEVCKFSCKLTNKSQKFLKKNINLGIIVATRRKIFRKRGCFLKFSENAMIFLHDRQNIAANRLYGPIPKELNQKPYLNLRPLMNKVI